MNESELTYEFYVVIASAFVYFYFVLHDAFLFIGEILFKKPSILKNYIRFINLIYFPICLWVLYEFTLGGFSIFAGWNLMSDNPDTAKDIASRPRGFLAYFLIIIVPILTFLISVVGSYVTYQRIKNPFYESSD